LAVTIPSGFLLRRLAAAAGVAAADSSQPPARRFALFRYRFPSSYRCE
jgi:hypothetical protein